MIRRVIGTAAIAVALVLPVSVMAQGVPGGIERGAREGERAAGPVQVPSLAARLAEWLAA